MRQNRSHVAILAIAIAAVMPFASAPSARADEIRIGTGGPTGVYFILGHAVCRMLKEAAAKGREHGITCEAPATKGSVENIDAIAAGKLQLGIAQSDVVYQASNGTGTYEGKTDKNLRTLFTVHAEPFQLVAGADTGINSWSDLAGQRVNVGVVGSGQRATFESVLLAYGQTLEFFGESAELPTVRQSTALCDGEIDAFGYTVGVPNAGVSEAADGCGARLISLDGPDIELMIDETPYFDALTIPADTYVTTAEDVRTFGVVATLVASAELSDEVAYEVTRAVMEDFETFTRLHPAFAGLDKQAMVQRGISSRFHPGAVRYFQEAGLIPQ